MYLTKGFSLKRLFDLKRFFGREKMAVALLLATLACPVHGQGESEGGSESLKVALEEMAHGRFDQAQSHQDSFSELKGRYANQATDLLSRYEALQEEIQMARREAYDGFLDEMNEAVNHAKWRASLLEASLSSSLESDDKSKFETEAEKKVETQWLKALGRMSLAKNLAERVNLPHTVSDEVRDTIVAASLEIAADYEAEKKWIDSYIRVYSYLVALDKLNLEYEEHSERLSRQASLIFMYVPDPNTDAIGWEEQRKGVTFAMIRSGLEQLSHQYVEFPDYQEMVLDGLKYCRYLAETPKLAEVFETLKNDQLIEAYLSELNALEDSVKSKAPEELNYTQVLEFLRQMQFVNQDTLKLPETVILAEFAEGAFSALDGYTYLVWPAEVAEFQKDMTSEFFGVGIEIGMPRDPNDLKGHLTVTSLLLDSPAMRAGLDADDRIIAIDGTTTENITMKKAVKRITGPKGTNVVLTIDRKGFDEPKDFTVVRDRIVVQTIRGLSRDQDGHWEHFVDREQGIAYVQIKSFVGETAGSLFATIHQLEQENLNGLILDLRRNSGGYLSAAIDIVNFFVDEGPIVSTRGRDVSKGYIDQVKATKAGTFREDLPMIVLVDAMSASASEIVSGALKDHGRALIIGSRTFGKGSVQTIQPLWASDARMKMTMAYYYLPSNRRVHRDPKDKLSKDYGVEPDLTIELTNQQLNAHFDAQRNAAILHQNGHNVESSKTKKSGLKAVLENDPVLQMAILCMTAELATQEMEQVQVAEVVTN